MIKIEDTKSILKQTIKHMVNPEEKIKTHNHTDY